MTMLCLTDALEGLFMLDLRNSLSNFLPPTPNRSNAGSRYTSRLRPGATLYAVCNEFFVKKADQVELLAMWGLFGAIVSDSVVFKCVLERKELKAIHWSSGEVHSLCLPLQSPNTHTRTHRVSLCVVLKMPSGWVRKQIKKAAAQNNNRIVKNNSDSLVKYVNVDHRMQVTRISDNSDQADNRENEKYTLCIGASIFRICSSNVSVLLRCANLAKAFAVLLRGSLFIQRTFIISFTYATHLLCNGLKWVG
ncbi:solute carrier family 35 member SLC35F1/F2/F6 [Artemisia annua]|uniref:Solute carrier family 35 member SLC35F1/F2/F6 n=1 Tax=Artemisia annua TaxID=35608 RepID=A0A2U1LVK3_ARTAN|nr:solute carrier family 35 member SLC35F1/F2/F6 [Artemisia annua]